MTPEQRAFFISLPDVEVLARTLYGEARNQGSAGLCAVANVVLNRANHMPRRYGALITNVCLKAWQFRCFNDNDSDLDRIAQPRISGAVMYRCRIVAAMAMDGLLVDNTGGATHYHHEAINPWWTDCKCMIYQLQIKNHLFYLEI